MRVKKIGRNKGSKSATKWQVQFASFFWPDNIFLNGCQSFIKTANETRRCPISASWIFNGRIRPSTWVPLGVASPEELTCEGAVNAEGPGYRPFHSCEYMCMRYQKSNSQTLGKMRAHCEKMLGIRCETPGTDSSNNPCQTERKG